MTARTPDDLADWIAEAVSGGNLTVIRRLVRSRAKMVLIDTPRPSRAVVVLPLLGQCNTADVRHR